MKISCTKQPAIPVTNSTITVTDENQEHNQRDTLRQGQVRVCVWISGGGGRELIEGGGAEGTAPILTSYLRRVRTSGL